MFASRLMSTSASSHSTAHIWPATAWTSFSLRRLVSSSFYRHRHSSLWSLARANQPNKVPNQQWNSVAVGLGPSVESDDERWPTQRHLNNTDFTQLFRDGWIGSCGTTSDEIRSWLEPLFEAGELVTVAIAEGS